MADKKIILGAGATGLAAGYATGWPVYEAQEHPGGLCSSYFLSPKKKERAYVLGDREPDQYLFETGGGHWLFGVPPAVEEFLRGFVSLKTYTRKASVYFSDTRQFVPYPIQYHLNFLQKDLELKILDELEHPKLFHADTFKESLETTFGPTLFSLFFGPFNRAYTAGIYDQIAPQDDYKTPVNLEHIRTNAERKDRPLGYNTVFFYPEEGLGKLSRRIADRCHIFYNKRAQSIDLDRKKIFFEDGSYEDYDYLFSTLPLNQLLSLSGQGLESDPYTSVLVLNIGAYRGAKTPEDHWVYLPHSENGFHRVGFYSNVDSTFLPLSGRQDRVSLYLEKTFLGGQRPSAFDLKSYQAKVVEELQSWGFISEVEIIDSQWIEVAYTWKSPHSDWRAKSLEWLRQHGVFSVGRFGRWHFQGIAESIQEGFGVQELLEGQPN